MKSTLSQNQKQSLVERYLSGESAKRIAADAGVARSSLYLWIHKYKTDQSKIGKNVSYKEFSECKRKNERLVKIIEILQMSPCSTLAPLQERLDVIEDFSAKYDYNVHTLCEAMKVAKGTFYNHILRNKRENTVYAQKYAELRPMIQEIHDEFNQILGPEKIATILKQRGCPTSKTTVARLMSDMGLRSIRNGAKDLYTKELRRQRKNILDRDFTSDAPNKVWISDVTQFNFNHCKFYICAILDVFSRKVISYHISKKNSTQLVKTTFKKAYESRKPNEGLLFHTDNGSNYVSNTFMSYLKKLGVTQSFSKAHTPYDNSVCESFFATLKREELYRYKYASVNEFMRRVKTYMYFYNADRPHKTLRYQTPDGFEAEYMRKQGTSI